MLLIDFRLDYFFLAKKKKTLQHMKYWKGGYRATLKATIFARDGYRNSFFKLLELK
jgi:hypothetical protein